MKKAKSNAKYPEGYEELWLLPLQDQPPPHRPCSEEVLLLTSFTHMYCIM